MDFSAFVVYCRAASLALDEYFCNADKGRDKKDPVYQYVVEGRDIPATYTSYSSCADRAHAKLWRLGCRRKFVNREERTPLPHDWHTGQNISSLHDVAAGSPCMVNKSGFACPPGASWVPAPGDEMLIWNKDNGSDAHSLSILAFDGTSAKTANYGTMGMSALSFPGCKEGTSSLSFSNGMWKYGSKLVQRVLTMEAIAATLTEAPDLTDIDGVVLYGMSESLDMMNAFRA
jgi:hypothetical protein